MSPASPKTQEPTMEEILASIRRIIADDQAAAQAEAAEDEDEAPQPEPEPEPADDEPQSQSAIDDMFAEAGDDEDEDDVLDLGEVAEPVAKVREPSPLDLDHEDIDFREAGPDLEPLAAFDEPELEEEEPEPEPEPEDAFAFDAPEPVPAPPPPRPRPAFDPPPPRREFDEERLLSDTTDAAVSGAFNMLAHTVLANNGRTLDDLVKEMLRPMLKVWLDDNLPVIVERLVRAEIERVSRGR